MESKALKIGTQGNFHDKRHKKRNQCSKNKRQFTRSYDHDSRAQFQLQQTLTVVKEYRWLAVVGLQRELASRAASWRRPEQSSPIFELTLDRAQAIVEIEVLFARMKCSGSDHRDSGDNCH